MVVNGAMTVDAHVTRAGIETETTMTTQWKVAGRAVMENGKKVSVRIQPPSSDNVFVDFRWVDGSAENLNLCKFFQVKVQFNSLILDNQIHSF